MEQAIPNNFPKDRPYGSLIVEVTAASRSLPLEGAEVVVRRSQPSDDDIVYRMITDRSGRTEKLDLEAPAAYLSQEPGNNNVYTTYDVEVTRDGYYTALSRNVPVFAGVTSIQPVNLVPISAFRPEENRPKIGTVSSEIEPEDL